MTIQNKRIFIKQKGIFDFTTHLYDSYILSIKIYIYIFCVSMQKNNLDF